MEVNVHILDIFFTLLCLLLCFVGDAYKKVGASALSALCTTQVVLSLPPPLHPLTRSLCLRGSQIKRTFYSPSHIIISTCTMSSFTSSRISSRAFSAEQNTVPVVRSGKGGNSNNSGSSQSNIKNGASSTGAVFF